MGRRSIRHISKSILVFDKLSMGKLICSVFSEMRWKCRDNVLESDTKCHMLRTQLTFRVKINQLLEEDVGGQKMNRVACEHEHVL